MDITKCLCAYSCPLASLVEFFGTMIPIYLRGYLRQNYQNVDPSRAFEARISTAFRAASRAFIGLVAELPIAHLILLTEPLFLSHYLMRYCGACDSSYALSDLSCEIYYLPCIIPDDIPETWSGAIKETYRHLRIIILLRPTECHSPGTLSVKRTIKEFGYSYSASGRSYGREGALSIPLAPASEKPPWGWSLNSDVDSPPRTQLDNIPENPTTLAFEDQISSLDLLPDFDIDEFISSLGYADQNTEVVDDSALDSFQSEELFELDAIQTFESGDSLLSSEQGGGVFQDDAYAGYNSGVNESMLLVEGDLKSKFVPNFEELDSIYKQIELELGINIAEEWRGIPSLC
ncbi:hypothetical protein ABW19_dt0209062 [Dactylella cylindrospora]|nr:hypothetical protein ABW19_dt0209062 [Dactylella cylindrospora]